MLYLLDTNIISRMRRIDRTPPQFQAWAKEIAYDQVYLSAITLIEIENGIIGAERTDQPFAIELQRWQERVLERFADRIMPVDTKIALRGARLNSQRSIGMADALIAATALEHGFAMVTHNIRHFRDFGLKLINPFPS